MYKMKNPAMVLIVLTVLLFFPIVSAPPNTPNEGEPPTEPGGNGNPVVLVANSVDYPLALDFVDFLEERFSLTSVNYWNFSPYKYNHRIIILGGPDAYEGTGNITRDVLSEEEEEEIRKTGNHAIYIKEDIFTLGQKVIVLAGTTRNETRLAHVEYRENVTRLLS